MENKNSGLSKRNYLFMTVAFTLIVLGFLLMTGKPSGVEFNPDIFSTRRIVVGPMVALFGFVAMIFAILYKPKKEA